MRKKRKVTGTKVRKALQTFQKLAVGLTKVWLTGRDGVNSPYIVAVDQVDDLIKEVTGQAK